MIPPDSHFVYALGWALVHFVWQGAALALAVRAAMAVLARRPANVRYVVACAGLAAMAIAPAATALMVSGPVPGTGVTVLVPAGEAVGVPAAHPPSSMTEAPPAAPSGAVRTSQLAALVEKSLGAIVVVWLVGVAAVSAVYLGGWVRVRRLVRRRVFPALERWERVAAELGRRMRVSRPVRCLESAAVGVPTLIGCLKPVILVPVGLATGLAPEEVEALLAHELAHVRRWDYLANMVQTAVETLLFYHPAVWWLSGRIRAEREQCCDEIVVATCGNRAAYARALAALADSQAVARPALAARGGRLLERIRRILAMQTERQGAVRWLAGSASLVGIAAVLVTALAIASCSGPGGGPSDAEKAPPAIADRPMMLSEAGGALDPALDMSPEDEKRLRETQQLLEKDIDVDFEQTSRADILKFLSGASGANIVVSPDVGVLMDGAEGLKHEINVHIKRVAIKHVLRIVLGEVFAYEVGPGYVLVKMKV